MTENGAVANQAKLHIMVSHTEIAMLHWRGNSALASFL